MPKADKPLKLLIFIHDLAPFGAQRVALHIAKRLDKSRFSAEVCSFWGDETLLPDFAAAGAKVHLLKARRFLDPRAWLKLAGLLLRSRPDIIQTNMPELSVPVRLFSLFVPGLHVVHSVQNPFSSEPWYWRTLNILTLFLCDRVVFCSRSMMERFGRAGERYSAVQNCIEAGPAPAGPGLRAGLSIGPGEKVVCCVARLARQKGQDVLIRAVAELAGRNSGVRLLLAGDGEDEADLRRLASGLGVADKVVFLGRRSDIAAVLYSSDVYAAPSRWEGLGIALGEAMLAGLPCVGTAIPGHSDMLKDGVTGLTVPPEDALALAEGISRLLNDPGEAGRLAAAARELIKAGFTPAGMVEKYEKIYTGLK